MQTLTDRHIHFEAVFDEGGMILYDPIGGAKGTFAMIGVGEKNCCDLRFIARSKGGHAAAPGKNTPLVRLGKFMAEVDGSAPFKKDKPRCSGDDAPHRTLYGAGRLCFEASRIIRRID